MSIMTTNVEKDQWPGVSGEICEVLMLLPTPPERAFAFAVVRKILHGGGKAAIPAKDLGRIAERLGMPSSVHSVLKQMRSMDDLFGIESDPLNPKAALTYSLRPAFAEAAHNPPTFPSWGAFLRETGRSEPEPPSKVVNIKPPTPPAEKPPAKRPDEGTYMFLRPDETIATAIPIKGYKEALDKAREYLRNNHDVTSVTLVQVRAEITLGERPVLVKEYL